MEKEPISRSEFWMKAAAFSFGAWAILLSIVGWLVAKGVDNILASNEGTRNELRGFIVIMEHRVTAVELQNERDQSRLQKLEAMELEHMRDKR